MVNSFEDIQFININFSFTGFVKLQGSEEQEHDPSGDDLEPTSRLRGGGPGTGTTKDWSHCSKDALCGHGRGDCDGNHQCEADHHCGNDNCRKFDTNAHRLADCCEKQGKFIVQLQLHQNRYKLYIYSIGRYFF